MVTIQYFQGLPSIAPTVGGDFVKYSDAELVTWQLREAKTIGIPRNRWLRRCKVFVVFWQKPDQ
jgi:hypothetical protein